MQDNWDQPIGGYGIFKLTSKLKRLKGVLKAWNTSVIGNLFENVKQAEDKVKQLEEACAATTSVSNQLLLNEAQA